GVVLAKVNVDEEQFIAAQFQVRSIPTVYALFQGQPVADLTSARSESQLRGVLDQLLEKLPIRAGGAGTETQDLTPLLAMGEEVLESGDAERAAGIYAQIVEMAPDNATAQAGLIRALIGAGRLEEAEAALAGLDPALADNAEIERAKSALELARDRPDDGELAALRSLAQASPEDMDAQLAYANAAFASGDREAAAEVL